MGRVWTAGLIWGILAWVPFFINLPLVWEVTVGLPVILGGYLLVLLEMVFGSIPNGVGFCLSLPVGVGLCRLFYEFLILWRVEWSEKWERGVK